ncbi:MAG: recombinase family protein [Acetobacteraceae bacterium]
MRLGFSDEISDVESGHDLRLRGVTSEAQDLTASTVQLKAARRQKVFREKITGMTADRPQVEMLMAALARADVVIIPAVGRPPCDTTDLLVIVRDM